MKGILDLLEQFNKCSDNTRKTILIKTFETVTECLTAVDFILKNQDKDITAIQNTFSMNQGIYKQVLTEPMMKWLFLELSYPNSMLLQTIPNATDKMSLFVSYQNHAFDSMLNQIIGKEFNFSALVTGLCSTSAAYDYTIQEHTGKEIEEQAALPVENIEQPPVIEEQAILPVENIEQLPVVEEAEPLKEESIPQAIEPTSNVTSVEPNPSKDAPSDDDIEFEVVKHIKLSDEERRNQIRAEKKRIQDYAVEMLGEEYAEYFENRIETDTRSIVNVYEGLFKAGLELERPLGVLTDRGYMKLDKNNMAHTCRESMLAKFFKNYNAQIENSIRIAEKNASITRANITEKKYTYFPEFQVRSAFGITVKKSKNGKMKMSKHLTWETFASAITSNIKEIIIRLIAQIIPENTADTIDDEVDKVLNELRVALTTCIVISEYDSMSSLKIRAYAKSIGVNAKEINSRLSDPSNPLFSGLGKVGLCQQDRQGVLTLSIIFDEEAEARKPLFAYQAIEILKEKGVKPDWKNFILGKNVLTDTIFTVNLSDANSYNCVIGAGPRSGKGVTTLNILATALSEGFPILYMDGKPEMAQMLWDLGEKYKTNVFAVDVNDIRAGMQYTNCPEGLEESLPNIGGLVAYFKGVQLALAVANIRLANAANDNVNFKVQNFDIKGKQRMIVVCDEIVKVKEKYDLVYLPFKDQIKKAGKKGTAASEWQTHLLEWLNALDSNLCGSLVSEIPMARQNWFWLTQKLDKTTWKIGDGDGVKTIVRGAVRTSKVMKLAGNGMTAGNNKLALPQGDKVAGRAQAEQYINKYQRCFAYHTQEEPSSYDGIDIIKPYLLLPNNDPDGESIRFLLDTPEEALRKAYDEDGVTFRDEIAFEGLVKMLLSSDDGSVDVEEAFRNNLSVGYDVAYTVLSMAGLLKKYANMPYGDRVYAYLYDLSPDTLVSVSSIINRIRMGDNYVESEADKLEGLEPFENVSESDLECSASNLEPLPSYLQKEVPQPVQGKEPILDSSARQSTLPNYLQKPTPEPQAALQRDMNLNDLLSEFNEMSYPTKEEVQQSITDSTIKLTPEDALPQINYNELYGNTQEENESEENLEKFTPSEPFTERERYLLNCIKDLSEKLDNLQQLTGTTQAVAHTDTNEYSFPQEQAEPMKNVINCKGSSKVSSFGKLKGVLLNTPIGTQMYADQLWRTILAESSNAANGGIDKLSVYRLSIYAEQLYINEQLVNLSSIINGPDGVRLSDVVNFEICFKYFKRLNTLSVDTDVLPKLLMEYNVSTLADVFEKIPQLQTLYILSAKGAEKVDRTSILKAKTRQQAILEQQAQQNAEEQYYQYKENKNGLIQNWKNCTKGQKVWLSGIGVNCMDNAFSTKSKGFVKRSLWFTAGLGAGVIGTGSWLTFNALRTLKATFGHYDIPEVPTTESPKTTSKPKKK